MIDAWEDMKRRGKEEEYLPGRFEYYDEQTKKMTGNKTEKDKEGVTPERWQLSPSMQKNREIANRFKEIVIHRHALQTARIAAFEIGEMPADVETYSEQELTAWIKMNFIRAEELPLRTIDTGGKGRKLAAEPPRNAVVRTEAMKYPRYKKYSYAEEAWYDRADHCVEHVPECEPRPTLWIASPREEVKRTIILVHGSFRSPGKEATADPTILLGGATGDSRSLSSLHSNRLVSVGGDFDGAREDRNMYNVKWPLLRGPGTQQLADAHREKEVSYGAQLHVPYANVSAPGRSPGAPRRSGAVRRPDRRVRDPVVGYPGHCRASYLGAAHGPPTRTRRPHVSTAPRLAGMAGNSTRQRTCANALAAPALRECGAETFAAWPNSGGTPTRWRQVPERDDNKRTPRARAAHRNSGESTVNCLSCHPHRVCPPAVGPPLGTRHLPVLCQREPVRAGRLSPDTREQKREQVSTARGKRASLPGARSQQGRGTAQHPAHEVPGVGGGAPNTHRVGADGRPRTAETWSRSAIWSPTAPRCHPNTPPHVAPGRPPMPSPHHFMRLCRKLGWKRRGPNPEHPERRARAGGSGPR